MIQDIEPKKYDPAFKRRRPKDEDILLHYEYNKVMLIKEGEGCRLPSFKDLKDEGSFKENAYYLFSIDGTGYFLSDDARLPEFGGFVMEGLQISGFLSLWRLPLPGLREARSIAGGKAGGSAAAAAEKWSRVQRSGPWSARLAATRSIRRSVLQ